MQASWNGAWQDIVKYILETHWRMAGIEDSVGSPKWTAIHVSGSKPTHRAIRGVFILDLWKTVILNLNKWNFIIN